jgi:UPF0755 protein
MGISDAFKSNGMDSGHGRVILTASSKTQYAFEGNALKTEKEKIASVYLNRLHKKMNMQACPTIKYALRDFALTRIYEKHLTVQSPYNTYINEGLPPGPVCTPQPETIDIVLNAPQTDYLYFVAKSDFSDAHEYTSNYNDHLKKAKEYQDALIRQESIRKANQ